MYHYLYKIINNNNLKFYIGVHSTSDIDDGYMGSGIAITEAIKKYGIDSFTKEIIEFFDTRESALKRESEIVTNDLVNDQKCYNLTLGGTFPPSRKDVPHTEETKNKISAHLIKNIDKCRENGKQSWNARKSKGGWTKEEIRKRVETRKKLGNYDNDMSAANSKESIKKRVETRKANGNYNTDTSYLKSPDVVYKRTRTRIINQMKKGQTFDESVLERYNIT